MQFFPFDATFFYPNPSFLNVGVPATIIPGPGAQALSYTITAGTLPAGLSLNATTGYVTGTPTTLSEATTVSITCLNVDTTTYVVNLIISVIAIPEKALLANQGSAQEAVSIAQYWENIFINDANTLIANAQSQGKFEIFMDLPWMASFHTLQTYYESLGYTFWPVYWRNNTIGEYGLSFGAYASPAGYQGYPLITRPGYPVESPNSRKVKISWASYPYNGNSGQWYPGWPSY